MTSKVAVAPSPVSATATLNVRKSRLNNLLHNPSLIGAATASIAVVLPPSMFRHSFDLLPHAVGDSIPPMVGRTLAMLPSRAYLLLFGFTLGFFGVKYFSWLRLQALKVLYRDHEWVFGAHSIKNKVWATLVNLWLGSGPFSTYEFQSCLPKLPLPDLDKTLDTWLQASSVFVAQEKHATTRQAVESFRRNEGPKLHAHLKKRSDSTVNWLSDYWMYAAYLSNRDPLMYYSNYYTTGAVLQSATTDQLARTATSIYHMTMFEKLLSRNQVPPTLVQDSVPLCMHGCRTMFNTVRVPGEHVDTITKHPGHRYAVVIRNGHYFKLDLYAVDGKSRRTRVLTAEEFQIQLQQICQTAEDLPDEPAVAALTAQGRTQWANHRQLLMQRNKATLDSVEAAMFMVAMDTAAPKTIDELSRAVMLGNGNDRWFDKSITHVSFSNSYNGNNVEHSVMDATVFLALNEYTSLNERYENGDVIRDPRFPPRTLPAPQHLQWNLEGMEEIVKNATEQFHILTNKTDIHIRKCKYGKGVMKKLRLSPDGYIQMVLQLAYYRLHKEIPKTYEPSSARFFALGRTETIHPGSADSVAWVKAMDDSEVSSEQRRTLLRQAIKYQNQFRLESTVGRGCDRHLLGLLCASRELGVELPDIFKDEAWRQSFKLSTSQTPTRMYELAGDQYIDFSMSVGGFGPGCHDGYGISYIIHGDNCIFMAISSWADCADTSSVRLGDSIDTAMADMRHLLTEENNNKS